jgi:flagellar protein FliL
MRRLIPILLPVVGLALGLAAGLFLKPAPDPAPGDAPEDAQAEALPAAAPTEAARLSNQFVVPVVRDERVAAMVVMALSIEVTAGMTSTVFENEPKLRDALLLVLFDHANAGGFDGPFTELSNLETLRNALREAAQQELGDAVVDVLITDLARQDA